jgi:alpha-L-fucosidase
MKHLHYALFKFCCFSILISIPATSFADGPIPSGNYPGQVQVKVSAQALPMATGKFEPTWDSLKQYQCPDWFRDAKFGIWSVWGPQALPEQGDWYARMMYMEGKPDYNYEKDQYGPQSNSATRIFCRFGRRTNGTPRSS